MYTVRSQVQQLATEVQNWDKLLSSEAESHHRPIPPELQSHAASAVGSRQPRLRQQMAVPSADAVQSGAEPPMSSSSNTGRDSSQPPSPPLGSFMLRLPSTAATATAAVQGQPTPFSNTKQPGGLLQRVRSISMRQRRPGQGKETRGSFMHGKLQQAAF